MSTDRTALVVGASEEGFEYIRQCLADWECVNAQLNDEETAIESIPGTPTLAIVFARRDEQNTSAICEQLRKSAQTATAPILLIISRYQIAQGHAVKRMGNASFIFEPFIEKDLRDKVGELVAST